MFNPKNIGRLLRTDWRTPSELARELVDLFTAPQPRQVNSPVEITVPPGSPGLKISRDRTRPTPTPTPSPPPGRPGSSPPSPLRPPGFKPGGESTPVEFSKPTLDLPEAVPIAAPASSSVASKSQPSSIKPTGGRPVPARKRASLKRAAQVNTPSQTHGGSLGEDYSPRTGGSPLPNYRKPYAAPAFEVTEEARFSSLSPVQFDRPPVIFNPSSDQYEPVQFKSLPYRFGAETNTFFWWGEVVSGSGNTYEVDLYAFPGDELEDTVSVTIWKISSNATLPAGTPLYPIHEADDGHFYAQVPVFLPGS